MTFSAALTRRTVLTSRLSSHLLQSSSCPSQAESLTCSLPSIVLEVANSWGLDRAQEGQDRYFCSPPCPYHLALCLAHSRCITIVCWVSEQVNSHNNLALSWSMR